MRWGVLCGSEQCVMVSNVWRGVCMMWGVCVMWESASSGCEGGELTHKELLQRARLTYRDMGTPVGGLALAG